MKSKVNRSAIQEIFNKEDKLLKHAQEKLGLYVYVLVDPNTSNVFYIGKGGGAIDGSGNQRVLDHFREARNFLANGTSELPTPKIKRILDIWKQGRDVEWWIVRHGIKNQKVCDEIEAALIDAFSLGSSNITNSKRGYGSKESGLISAEDVLLFNPPPVNPSSNHAVVFLFPINQLIGDRKDLYESTRKYWDVKEEWRTKSNAIAIGINSQTSAAVFEIDKWRRSSNKFAFTGMDVTESNELARKDFSSVINSVKGYWQRGQFLIVEFDGNGRYRFHRGSTDKEWINL